MSKHLKQDNIPVKIHQSMKKSHSEAFPVRFKNLLSYVLMNGFSVADVSSL